MVKKRKVVIIMGSLLILLLGGGIVFVLFSSNKKQETTHQLKNPPPSPNDDNSSPPQQSGGSSEKKILANQIKEDLQKDLAEAKKADTLYYDKNWIKWNGYGCDCNGDGRGLRLDYRGEVETDAGKEKKKKGEIWPNELETDDWEAIMSLIQQRDNLNGEIEKRQEQKKQKWEAELDQKLKSNPKIFFYEGLDDWEDYTTARHFFLGWENGKRYKLVLPEKHSAIASLPNNQGDNPHLKQTGFYLIEGVSSMPFQSKKIGLDPYKEVNLSDKITIAPLSS